MSAIKLPDWLAILREGVDPWNEYRQKFPNQPPDLHGVNLSNASLEGIDLTNANLTKTNFR